MIGKIDPKLDKLRHDTRKLTTELERAHLDILDRVSYNFWEGLGAIQIIRDTFFAYFRHTPPGPSPMSFGDMAWTPPCDVTF